MDLWFFIRSARLYYLGESIESAAVNALDAKKAWLEAYYQNNDCRSNLNVVIMKWQQIGNRKSASQNNICNRDKITAEKK